MLEHGQFSEAAFLSDAVYTDDRVSGVVDTRINGLFGLPLEFRYPGQAEAKAKKKPALAGAPTQSVGAAPDRKNSPEAMALKLEIVEKVRQNWEKMFPGAALREQMRWGLFLNAGLGELVWDFGADGLYWPTLKTWNSQFIYWRWDTRSYWLITQDGPVEVHAGDGHWMMLSPRGHNHGWLYGLIRALGKLWLDRQFLKRDWARVREKLGVGIMKAKVPSNASDPNKTRFEASLTNMPNESTILLPQGGKDEGSFDVEMLQTDTAVNWQSFVEGSKQIDTDIAVCVLGQNLTTEVQSGGSRAAATVHESVKADLIKADDEMWATTVRTQVLHWLVEYNWGDVIRAMGLEISDFVPEVAHKTEPPEDLKQKADAILAISQALIGFAGTNADINALLEQHGIPVTDAKETEGEPAPGDDVNERPPSPPNPEENPDPADERVVHIHGRRRLESKPGQRKGRVLVDELVEAAVAAGAATLQDRKHALLKIIRTASTLSEVRARVLELYRGLKPSQLRGVVEKSVAAAHLLGRLTARVDHHA